TRDRRSLAPRQRRALAGARTRGARRAGITVAALRARDLVRIEIAGAHRSLRPPGCTAHRARAELFPAREPAPAPAVGAHRASLTRRRVVQGGPERRECMGPTVFRSAYQAGRSAVGHADPARCDADAGYDAGSRAHAGPRAHAESRARSR